MKFIRCTAEMLSKPVKIVSGIVERNQALPVISNILVEQNNAEVSFTTTDLDVQMKTTAMVGVDECAVRCTISAQKLSEILNALKPQDQIELTIDDNNRVMLETATGSFNLQTLPVRDFPEINTTEWLTTFQMPAKQLRYQLSMTSFAMASKDVRYYLNGVHFATFGDVVKCAATDTHRLAYCESTIEGLNVTPAVHVTIPRKTVRELLRILPEDDAVVEVSLSSTQCAFRFDGVDFVSKLVDGQFPDYERVIPTQDTNNQPITVEREALILALRRVQILTNEKFHGVRWLLSNNNLMIQGTNAEQEEASQNIAVTWPWAELDIGFNVVYLLEVLSALKTSEVTFHFAPTPRSVLLTMPETLSFRYVIMPMRI